MSLYRFAIERRVLVKVPMSSWLGRDVARGVVRYAQVVGSWEVIVSGEGSFAGALQSAGRVDGAVVVDWGRESRGRIAARGLPVVFAVSGGREDPLGVGGVGDDQEALVDLAYLHLSALGHERFAFVGPDGPDYNRLRGRKFSARCESEGHRCEVILVPSRDVFQRQSVGLEIRLAEELGKLAKPVAVFVHNVQIARRVADACRRGGILVPEQAALLAVGEDDILAWSTIPSLSTIDQNARRIGYEAAALLERHLSGEEVTGQLIEIPPAGVVQRRSTDSLAIPDVDVARALRALRTQACEDVSLEEILSIVPSSRRKLEMGFQRYLDCSPQQERNRVRVERAKELLRMTDLPLADIVAKCGFSSRSRMHEHFVRRTGLSPGGWRSLHHESYERGS